MTERDICSLLGGLELNIQIVDECVSTNSELKRLAPALPADTVLIARRQTGGRGRMGRSFFSPEGTGLYMSILLRPELPAGDLPLLTPAAALAVCGAVEDIAPVKAEIKWVNDVYVSGKKVCGILTETVFGPDGVPEYCVVGIGVNLAPPPGGFPPEISGIAGAVLPEPRPGAPEALAAGILRRFYGLLPTLPSLSFVPEYRSRSLLLGRDIWVIRDGVKTPARVTGVDERCGLQVLYPDGTAETLSSGEVTVRERGVEP